MGRPEGAGRLDREDPAGRQAEDRDLVDRTRGHSAGVPTVPGRGRTVRDLLATDPSSHDRADPGLDLDRSAHDRLTVCDRRTARFATFRRVPDMKDRGIAWPRGAVRGVQCRIARSIAAAVRAVGPPRARGSRERVAIRLARTDSNGVRSIRVTGVPGRWARPRAAVIVARRASGVRHPGIVHGAPGLTRAPGPGPRLRCRLRTCWGRMKSWSPAGAR